MSNLPSTIRNLGPASDQFYGAGGITTAQQLIELGPDEAYYRALQAGGKPHFIGYYAMVMGLQGRPWNDCQGSEKDALKQRFAAIKARLTPQDSAKTELERALDALGVIPKS